LIKEGVPEVVTATYNLNLVQVVSVDGGETDTAVVHLTGENFITKEVVTEDTRVRVSEVVGVSHSDIRKITKESVHRVILLFHVIEVLSMLIDTVRAEHVFKEEECVVVLVFDTRGIVEDSNI